MSIRVVENSQFKLSAEELLNDILRHGAAKGIRKPERLKYRKAWSRRINKEHRLIYTEENGMYIIYSLKGHYEEK